MRIQKSRYRGVALQLLAGPVIPRPLGPKSKDSKKGDALTRLALSNEEVRTVKVNMEAHAPAESILWGSRLRHHLILDLLAAAVERYL